MNQSNETILKKICQLGTYFNPASKHYKNNSKVSCDRCRKQNIDICIGWDSYDLCMKCVQEVNNIIISEKNEPQMLSFMQQSQFITNMEQSQFLTNMEQSQFRQKPKQFPNTKMMQSMFW